MNKISFEEKKKTGTTTSVQMSKSFHRKNLAARDNNHLDTCMDGLRPKCALIYLKWYQLGSF